jgi:hypothetical protein
MNSQQWLKYYQRNCMDRPEPKWNSPSSLSRDAQRILGHSLSHFQLGETGEGKVLISGASRQVGDDACYIEALTMFVAEEGEHARLLDRLVRRFGGEIIRRHWTHGLFRLVRHALGFKFEIQLLVIAELVGTAYYRLVRARTSDSVLDETCALLLTDEAKHIEFHADWLGNFMARLLPLEYAIWTIQFQVLFTAAAYLAWIDHRHALRISGSCRREFFKEARGECIRFLRSLEQNAEQQVKQFAPVPVAS